MAGVGIFGNITGMLGETNPYDEMRDYQARQNAQNNAALGLDANGNPLPPPPPGAGPPGLNPPSAKGPTKPTAPGEDPTQPQAYATPKDLGSMMLDMQQYNERQQGFNQALGMGFAAFAQPRDRQMVSQMFNVTPGDPTRIGQTLMNLNSQQQGQNRANMVMRLVNDPNQGPQIARAFGMDWEGLKAGVMSDPSLVAKIAETWGTADERVRAGAQVGHGALGGAANGPSGGPSSDIGKQIVSGVAGDPNMAMNQAQMAWDHNNPGQPTPWDRNDVASFQRYTKDQQDRQDNARTFLTNNHALGIDKTTEFQHLVEGLKTDPGMHTLMQSPNYYKSAINWIKNNPDSTPAQLATALPDWAGYPPEVKNALSVIQQLHSRDYAQAMHSIGQRFSTTEVQNVSRGMDRLLDLQLGPKDYQDGLDQLIEETKTIRANSHGAAQEFDTMDPDLRTYVNPTFIKGGRSNVQGSGSESWADSVIPDQKMISDAKEALAKGVPRKTLEQEFRKQGKRPMGF